MANKKYEYMVFNLNFASPAIDRLNGLGLKGWKIVGSNNHSSYVTFLILMREKNGK